MKYPEKILGIRVFEAHTKALEDFHEANTEHEVVKTEDKSIVIFNNGGRLESAKRYPRSEVYYVLYPEENLYMKKALRGVSPAILEQGNMNDILNINPYAVSNTYLSEFISDYNFEDASMASSGMFTYEGMDEGEHKFTALIYLEFPGSSESEKASFHVMLDANFNLVDRYVLLHSNGAEFGYPEGEREADKPSAPKM